MQQIQNPLSILRGYIQLKVSGVDAPESLQYFWKVCPAEAEKTQMKLLFAEIGPSWGSGLSAWVTGLVFSS